MAERTGCPVLLSLWSYVIVECLKHIHIRHLHVREYVALLWKPKDSNGMHKSHVKIPSSDDPTSGPRLVSVVWDLNHGIHIPSKLKLLTPPHIAYCCPMILRDFSPSLPDLLGQHSPHNRPVSKRACLLPTPESLCIIPQEDTAVTCQCCENVFLDFVLWKQERFPCSATKEVVLGRLAKCHWKFRIRAENHQVGEITAVGCECGG
jgi:hypothetical protein